MKLRNKKTGKIIDKICVHICSFDVYENECKEIGIETRSLEKVLETWEDYVPKEPLIKDEKIRKAVRAWADLYDYKFVTHRFYITTTGHRWSLLARETQEICLPDLDGLEEPRDYTIAELCGEEEE